MKVFLFVYFNPFFSFFLQLLFLSSYCKSMNLFYRQILYTTKLYFYLFSAFKLSKDNLYVFDFHLLYLKEL